MNDRQFAKLADDINSALTEFATSLGGPPDLQAACNYVLLSPGKRVRGVLCCLTSEASGSDAAAGLPYAVAIEAVHAASLILDDLPAMDDAATRRGKPSAHAEFGEATAILAAIALLNGAYAHLASQATPSSDVGSTAGVAVDLLTRAVGGLGLVGGQMRDISSTGRTLDGLVQLHGEKTGALFAAALALGTLAGGHRRAGTHDVIWACGHNLGVAFQGYDDLLDVFAEASTVGKPVGLDQAKTTLATLMSRSDAEIWCYDHLSRAVATIDEQFGAKTRLAHYIDGLHAALTAPLTKQAKTG
ncbi:MAG: polyprenyl synthetase family protein [Pseudomonadota bacterium]